MTVLLYMVLQCTLAFSETLANGVTFTSRIPPHPSISGCFEVSIIEVVLEVYIHTKTSRRKEEEDQRSTYLSDQQVVDRRLSALWRVQANPNW